MALSKKMEYSGSNSRKDSLQHLANVCREAYKAGLTLEEVHFVSGAAWADFLDPREPHQ